MKVIVSSIRTEEELTIALARMDEIFMASMGTVEADEREILGQLIENYDQAHHPLTDEIKAKSFPEYVKELGLTTKALMPLMGNKQRVSEILHGR